MSASKSRRRVYSPLPFLQISETVRLDKFVASADRAGHSRDPQPGRRFGVLLDERTERDASADL